MEKIESLAHLSYPLHENYNLNLDQDGFNSSPHWVFKILVFTETMKGNILNIENKLNQLHHYHKLVPWNGKHRLIDPIRIRAPQKLLFKSGPGWVQCFSLHCMFKILIISETMKRQYFETLKQAKSHPPFSYVHPSKMENLESLTHLNYLTS